jgi:hypothetical protein
MSIFAFEFVSINGTAYAGVSDASLDFRETVLAEGESGQTQQTFAGVVQGAPMARFTAKALGTLAGLLQAGAVPYITPTALVCTAPSVAQAAPGYQASAGQSYTFVVPGTFKPIIVPERISWQMGQAAEIVCAAYAVSADGSTAPITQAGAAAVPTVTGLGQRYGLASATLAGTALAGLQSVEISIGHQIENNRPECFNVGLPWPTLLSQPGVGGPTEITATLRLANLAQGIASGNLVLVFQQMANTGVGLAGGTLTVTLRSGLARAQQVSGKPGMIDVLVHGTFDGTNATLSLVAA